MKALLLIALLLLPWCVGAQSFTVKGVVRAKADRTALPGVSILEKGTTNGTSTDAAGRFTLVTTRPTPRLRVSYIGYSTQEVVITKNKDSLTVFLQEDVRALSEVVVTGVGYDAPKRSVGYSASAVSTTLAGKAPGVMIRGASSVPAAPRHRAALRDDEKAVSAAPSARAGVLTAGELNDFGKWKLWPDIAQKDLSEWRQRWELSPLERYAAQLITEDGFPVMGATVLLKDSRDSLIWQARTDNTGKCELWNRLFGSAKEKQADERKVASLQAVVDGKTYSISRPTVFHEGINSIRVKRPCVAPSVLDIAFVVDATGSMGDEIQYLQAELSDVMARVKDSLATSTINLGSVFYRDAGDEYVTRKTGLSSNIQQTVDFIRQQQANGGGDTPEAVDAALAVAVNELAWTANAQARLLFLILDAPPHENPQVLASLQQSIRRAAAKGIRIVPIAASGIDKSTEYLMRAMALATNGTYVFLTDDSGVGNAHIKPTTDNFTVERLNALLVKLIARYAYTADCQAPTASTSRPAGTLSGQYQQAADTAAVTTKPGGPGHTYSWKCYPNPASEALHVELEGSIKELFITDVTGKIVLRAAPAHPKVTVQLGSFPTGIYFLTFFTGKKWEKTKFLVRR